ncbi:MAG: hypothetical protein FJX20_14035 [Alphaproteobacteria bacterium]|nr:hypothetical protein [Alphaproteobacteria bacterium]
MIALVFSRRRGGGAVIDAGGGNRAGKSASAKAPAASTGGTDDVSTAGDLLRAEGADAYLEFFADWLEDKASEALGDEAVAPEPTRRLANAAREILPTLLRDGRATVVIPALVAGADGPKDFRQDVDLATLEPVLVGEHLMGIRELLYGHGEDQATVALGHWLMNQAEGDGEAEERDLWVSPDAVLRIADATRAAIRDLNAQGRAEVVVRGLVCQRSKKSYDLVRTVDTAVMNEAREGLAHTDSFIADLRRKNKAPPEMRRTKP